MVNTRQVGAFVVTMHPKAAPDRQLTADRGHGSQQRARDDEVLGSRNTDAVRECITNQARVDQGSGTADMGYPQPHRNEIDAVRHQQAHNIASCDPLCQSPTRVTFGALNKRTIGQVLVIVDECGRRPVGYRNLSNH